MFLLIFLRCSRVLGHSAYSAFSLQNIIPVLSGKTVSKTLEAIPLELHGLFRSERTNPTRRPGFLLTSN
jgi:hypothetical protein